MTGFLPTRPAISSMAEGRILEKQSYPVKAMTSAFGISDSVIVNGVIPMFRKLAKKNKLKVIDLHSLFDGHPEWLISDGIHPNDKGAAVIAEEVKKAIGEDTGNGKK